MKTFCMNSPNCTYDTQVMEIPAVLFLIFNRPDLTKMVFNRIREVRPEHLYIAADGPRKNNPTDVEKCKETRRIVDLIDWNCEVKTLFREENLGCGQAVKSATDWFFSQEESGIILEDDCLPDPTFFQYCAELLLRYKDVEKIGVISGDQFVKTEDLKTSYYFTNFPHLWGWATWRRVWINYDFNMKDWPRVSQTKLLTDLTGSKYYADKWKEIFGKVFEGKIDTWDYQFVFMLWVKNQLSIAPKNNLVINIGFGPGATHTTNQKELKHVVDLNPVNFPLLHPNKIQRNLNKEKSDLVHVFGESPSLLEKTIRSVRFFLGV